MYLKIFILLKRKILLRGIVNKKILLVDMDDVIVDLHTAWCDFYNKKYSDNMNSEYFRKDWDIHNRVKCGTDIYKILAVPGFGTSLKPMENAIESIYSLQYEYNLFILSHASCSGRFCLEKHIWIKNNLPEFDLGKLILCRDKWLIRGDIIIDDNYENVSNWLDRNPGCNGFLFDAPHNRGRTSGFSRRVFSWSDILKNIL